MDLIYTNANGVDQGILVTHSFDLSFGVSENDFEVTVASDADVLESGGMVYIEGTEYGGMVNGIKSSTDGETVTHKGRSWHGIMNTKVIQPNAGEDHLIVSGDANEVLGMLIARLGLSGLFVAVEKLSGINIVNYQFARYCKAYDGIRTMLAANGAKLKIVWENRTVQLSAEPIVDYTDVPVDGDIATLTVERYDKKVNHLICLGRGDLAEREVVHLYVDRSGRIGTTQYYTGLDEVMDVYDNSNAESSDELRKGGIERLTELLDTDKAEMAIPEHQSLSYDIGDIVGASDIHSGIRVSSAVSQKIVKINNGTISIEYKTGG